MPELPEVESVREGLSQLIINEEIARVEVLWNNIIESPDVQSFKERLVGQKFERVDRRGKFLLFYQSEDVLISHLRMEGKYQYKKIADEKENLEKTKHKHVIFYLKSGYELAYFDVRKFGRMSLVKKGEEFEHKSLKKLGPEPFSEDFKLEEMRELLKRRTKAIKGVLLDQKLVVGIGNIYADEILFQSKIYPARAANELSKDEENILYYSIIEILSKAVKQGGTTIRSYENAFGENGNYQEYLKVYGKEGEDCPRCGSKIEKTKIVGRGSHFCPNCQEVKK